MTSTFLLSRLLAALTLSKPLFLTPQATTAAAATRALPSYLHHKHNTTQIQQVQSPNPTRNTHTHPSTPTQSNKCKQKLDPPPLPHPAPPLVPLPPHHQQSQHIHSRRCRRRILQPLQTETPMATGHVEALSEAPVPFRTEVPASRGAEIRSAEVG